MDSGWLCVLSLLQFLSKTETYEYKQLKNLCKWQHRHPYPETQWSPKIRNKICQLRNNRKDKKRSEIIRPVIYVFKKNARKWLRHSPQALQVPWPHPWLESGASSIHVTCASPAGYYVPIEPSSNVQKLSKVPGHTDKINAIWHWKLKSS